MEINKREYSVTPYIESIKQCYKCLRLGHLQKDCRSKGKTCATCGKSGHTPQTCTAPSRRCINCKGDHSAAYLGCPARKEQTLANKLRAQTYMPRAVAHKEAKTFLKKDTNQETSQSPNAWRTISPANSYAGVTKGPRPVPKPRKNLPKPTTNKPVNQPIPEPNHQIQLLIDSINDLKKQVEELKEENKQLRTKLQKNTRQNQSR